MAWDSPEITPPSTLCEIEMVSVYQGITFLVSLYSYLFCSRFLFCGVPESGMSTHILMSLTHSLEKHHHHYKQEMKGRCLWIYYVLG